MTNQKIFGYKKQNDCENDYHPQNLHLVWEDDLYGIYFVRADNNKILSKSTDKMATISTVETRTNANIARGWHDKTNHIIYLVDCDYDLGNSYVWSIDLSDDSITEVETITNTDVFDIWRYDSETYVLYFSDGYTRESGNINPNGDVATGWWSVVPGPSHFGAIDEGTTPNTGDVISSNAANENDTFNMGTIDMSGYDSAGVIDQVYQIRCYAYNKYNGTINYLKVTGSETGMEQATITSVGADGWTYCTWSGLSLTQAELNSLQIEILSGDNAAPANIQLLYTMYCKIYFYGDLTTIVTIKNLDTSDEYEKDMGERTGKSYYISQVSIVDDQFWFLFKWSNENVELWKFDLGDELFTEMEDCGSATELPSIEQGAIAYDGSDAFYFVLGVGTKEVSTIVAVAPAGIDDGDYITYSAIQRNAVSGEYEEVDYYIWFDKVGDESGDPAPAGRTKITVDISGAADAQDVSDAIQAAVDAVTLITCANGGGTSTTCTLTCHHCGNTTNIADVDSGLSVATTTPGVNVSNYQYSYEITDDTLTQGGEFNVCLMLNRNSWTATLDSNNARRISCYMLEKGFWNPNDTDEGYQLRRMKVYQIPSNYSGRVNFIANWLRTRPSDKIVAITDSYCVIYNNSESKYELWEFVDLVAEGLIWEITINHPEREFPTCKLQWKKATGYSDPPAQNQLVQVFGRYTSNTL